jgi:predicted small lipoprotein YifL
MLNTSKYKGLVWLGLSMITLSGCGQKQPLYMPKNETNQSPVINNQPTTASIEQENN